MDLVTREFGAPPTEEVLKLGIFLFPAVQGGGADLAVEGGFGIGEAEPLDRFENLGDQFGGEGGGKDAATFVGGPAVALAARDAGRKGGRFSRIGGTARSF